MISQNGQDYYWMRITARLIIWENDQSLHMLTYRQNIDTEKKKEYRMQELAQTDEMTGLLTKNGYTASNRVMSTAEFKQAIRFLFLISIILKRQ